MTLKRKLVVLTALLFVATVVYATTQSVALRNLFYALNYERTLDTYSQKDTTASDVTANLDANGEQTTLLTAFFGLDDTTPRIANRVVCENAAGLDGMPVIFSHEINVKTLEPGDFKVTTQSGSVAAITCTTLAPADDPGELRTVLLVGQLGSMNDQPASVEIIGNVLSLDGSVNFKGATVDVTPLEAGPSLVMARVLPRSEWTLGQEATAIPFGGGDGCPEGTQQVIRVTWEGGVTKPDGREADDLERQQYKITLIGQDGANYETVPSALADLGDGDNNHKLCLDTTDTVVSIAFPAGYLADPRDDVNPATSVTLPR